PRSATSRPEQVQQTRRLFDHLVGTQQERFRDGYPGRLGGLHIDGQLEFRRLLDRQVRGLRPLQNLVHVEGAAPEQVRYARAVRQETASDNALPSIEHPRKTIVDEKIDNPHAADLMQWIV